MSREQRPYPFDTHGHLFQTCQQLTKSQHAKAGDKCWLLRHLGATQQEWEDGNGKCEMVVIGASLISCW